MKQKLFSFILTLFSISIVAQNNEVDSLFKLLKNSKDDTNKVNLFIKIGIKFENVNPDTAIFYFTKAKYLSEILNQPIKEAEANRQLGWSFIGKGDFEKSLTLFNQSLVLIEKIENIKAREVLKSKIYGGIGSLYRYQSNYPKALEFYFKALKIDEKFDRKNGLAIKNGNIGNVYSELSNFPKALEYYFKSLKINEEIGDKNGVSSILSNIGIIYSHQLNYSKALDYYFKALKISEEVENKYLIASNLGYIGNTYQNQNESEFIKQGLSLNDRYFLANKYYFKALDISEQLGNKYLIATWLGNIGNVYEEQLEHQKALEFYYKSLEINEELGNKNNIATQLSNIGAIYTKTRNFYKAESYLKNSLSISKEIKTLVGIRDSEKLLSELYHIWGNYKGAFNHYQNYIAIRDSIDNEENFKKLILTETKYEYEKKSAIDSISHNTQLELKNAELTKQYAEIKVKKNQQYALFGGLFLVIVFAGIMYNRFKVTQKQKFIIEDQKFAVEKQKEVIEEAHKEIKDSINYAERIQRSFLATNEILDERLVNYFVFFRPKDVVSGDFYWAARLKNDSFAYCCADSTGHGVPGAIMSILNISSLEKSIETQTEPHKILNETRKIIINRLKNDGSIDGGKDGMDCSLLVLSKDKKQLKFAAAHNSVYIIRNREIIEYKGDKMPVGKHDKENKPFTLNNIELYEGDIIYTLTDGFQDQFGGPKGKKYMIKNLKELLLEISYLPMKNQKDILSKEFDNWKKNEEQVDDVCIIGVQV